MNEALAQLHFLRPEWLWALIPSILVWWLLFRQKDQETQWQQLIDPELLEPMTQAMPLAATQPRQRRLGLCALLLSWGLSILALVGPSWEQLPIPASTNADALIIALDLSYSMLAEDVKPSRLERAKFKIHDILDHRGEGYTALIAYAGDAHVVSPLTQDTNTVRNLVNPLSPLIMPAPGSRPDKAIKLAEMLRAQAGLPKARTLIISDDIIETDITRIRQLPLQSTPLSLLAVGTAAGAPISIPNRGFLRNPSGELVLPTMNYALFEQLADTTNARVAQLSVGDNDWRHLIPEDVQYAQPQYQPQDQQRQTIDQWRDAGVWLVLGLLPLAALSFRRGWLFTLALVSLLPLPQPSMALEWQDLWQTPDQQAQALYKNDPKAAANTFSNPEWRAMAHYKAGEYEQAINHWQSLTTAESAYNLGNAYAKMNRLNDAISAYQQALALKSPFPEAQENLEYVKTLLNQQQQQQNPQAGASENADMSSPDSKEQYPQQDQETPESQSQTDQGASSRSTGRQSKDTQSKDTQSKDTPSNGSQMENQNAQNAEQQGQATAGNQTEQQTPTGQASSASAAEDINEALTDDNPSLQPTPDLRALEAAAQAKTEQQAQPEAAQARATETDALLTSEQQHTDALVGSKDLQDSLDPEQYQALQQWLNRVPEDPSGLLKRKFLYEYKKRQLQQAQQESKVW